jgi:UDP-2,3-diacylglucosamine pyrophosphatase LpxH
VETPEIESYKIVVSDCHLSAGRIFEGGLNPHEDFHFDDEMAQLFDHFCSGKYGWDASGRPIEVELVLAGDYLDPLNVPVEGEFEDSITESVALKKIEAILQGHPRVWRAIRDFASRPGKRVTYLIGNHDADLFFEKVRERITREWDPEGRYPSPAVRLVADTDRLTYPELGLEIRHGNQFEAGSVLNFQKPLLTEHLEEPVLNMPWSSFFVLKIINRLKWEREYLDKIRPVKVFVLFGMIVDPFFTIRFVFLSLFYFFQTRFVYSPVRRATWGVTYQILKQESGHVFLDLEKEAREVLSERKDLKTLIMGHTHRPMDRVWPDGKQYINTGTWTKMVNLDLRGLGQQVRRTFAYVQVKGGSVRCELRNWVGESGPHQIFDR